MFRALFLAICALVAVSSAAAACPAINLEGYEIRARASDLYRPAEFQTVAGGDRSIDNCGIRNRTDGIPTGYATTQPDFKLYFVQDGRYQLEFRVVSRCDSMLLINTGGANWYWDDDDNGDLDPKIRLTRPSEGWYDIWIGTIGPDNCDAVLIIESF